MSKSEGKPNAERRMMIGNTDADPSALTGGRRLKPQRGCLFIDVGNFPEPSFCFSAARTRSGVSNRNASSEGAGAHQFAPSRAAEKQKVNRGEASFGYKQGTPTGLGRPRRGADRGGGRGRLRPAKILPFGFRVCFELRNSEFGFIP